MSTRQPFNAVKAPIGTRYIPVQHAPRPLDDDADMRRLQEALLGNVARRQARDERWVCGICIALIIALLYVLKRGWI